MWSLELSRPLGKYLIYYISFYFQRLFVFSLGIGYMHNYFYKVTCGGHSIITNWIYTIIEVNNQVARFDKCPAEI